MGHELVHLAGLHPERAAVEHGRVFPEEILHEEGNVLETFPQRGNPDGEDVEAVEEVLPEGAGSDHGPEVPVRCCDNTGVEAAVLFLADPAVFFFLEGAQKLALLGDFNFAYLIEKECAVLGGFKEAYVVGVCSREGAPDVTEEFAFEEIPGNSRAVDLDERAVFIAAVFVDLAGDEFLARAGLANDEDKGVRSGHGHDLFLDALNGLAFADESVDEIGVINGAVQVLVFNFELALQAHQFFEGTGMGYLDGQMVRDDAQAIHNIISVVAAREEHDDADDFLHVDKGLAEEGVDALSRDPGRACHPGHVWSHVGDVQRGACGRDDADLVYAVGHVGKIAVRVVPDFSGDNGMTARSHEMQTFGVVCAEFPVMAGRAGVSGDLGEPDAHESRLGHDTEGCGDEIEELLEIFAAAHAEEEVVPAVHAVQELQARIRVLIAGEEFQPGDEGVYGLADSGEHGSAAADMGAVVHLGGQEIDDFAGHPAPVAVINGVGAVVLEVVRYFGKLDGIGIETRQSGGVPGVVSLRQHARLDDSLGIGELDALCVGEGLLGIAELIL